MIDFQAIKQAATPHLPGLIQEAFPNGKRHGREWRTGDAYGDKGASCAISLQDGAFFDHGTGEHGDILALWATRFSLSVGEAAKDLASRIGISANAPSPMPAPTRDFEAEQRREDERRTDLARGLWREAHHIAGTQAADYLSKRGITVPPPPTLRFVPKLKHLPSGMTLPAMVAAITVEGEQKPVAVHRTFLEQDKPTKARIEPAKMILGPCKGGAVRLARVGSKLILGEGIESTLSAMQAAELPGWACLSTSGLRGVILPDLPIASDVTIAADNDKAGIEAANEAAERLRGEGRTVRIALPPEPGTDFNDLIQGSAA